MDQHVSLCASGRSRRTIKYLVLVLLQKETQQSTGSGWLNPTVSDVFQVFNRKIFLKQRKLQMTCYPFVGVSRKIPIKYIKMSGYSLTNSEKVQGYEYFCD